VSGLVFAAEGMGRMTARVVKKTFGSKKSKQKSPTLQAVEDLGIASLRGITSIWESLETAGQTLLSTTRESTVDLVDHKYGEECAKVVDEGLSIGTDVIKTAVNIRALGPKAIAKSVAKNSGKAAARTLFLEDQKNTQKPELEGPARPPLIEYPADDTSNQTHPLRDHYYLPAPADNTATNNSNIINNNNNTITYNSERHNLCVDAIQPHTSLLVGPPTLTSQIPSQSPTVTATTSDPPAATNNPIMTKSTVSAPKESKGSLWSPSSWSSSSLLSAASSALGFGAPSSASSSSLQKSTYAVPATSSSSADSQVSSSSSVLVWSSSDQPSTSAGVLQVEDEPLDLDFHSVTSKKFKPPK